MAAATGQPARHGSSQPAKQTVQPKLTPAVPMPRVGNMQQAMEPDLSACVALHPAQCHTFSIMQIITTVI
jgi:hypothetical protein